MYLVKEQLPIDQPFIVSTPDLDRIFGLDHEVWGDGTTIEGVDDRS